MRNFPLADSTHLAVIYMNYSIFLVTVGGEVQQFQHKRIST